MNAYRMGCTDFAFRILSRFRVMQLLRPFSAQRLLDTITVQILFLLAPTKNVGVCELLLMSPEGVQGTNWAVKSIWKSISKGHFYIIIGNDDVNGFSVADC